MIAFLIFNFAFFFAFAETVEISVDLKFDSIDYVAGERVRAVATRYLDLFQPAAVIHDMRNYVSDGSHDRFHYANMEFLVNCLKLANAAYPWYSWRRYRAHAVAIALYDFVDGPGGWRAWLDCHQRNLSRKERRERKESL